MSEKTCTVCKERKPLSEFSPCRGGHQPSCKACRNLKAKFINIPVTVSMKKCRSCEKTLEAERFNRSKRDRSGLQSECKSCTNARKRNANYPVTLSEKTCCDCGVTKPASAFPRDCKRVGGLRKECRECCSVRVRACVYSISYDESKRLCGTEACEICKEPFISLSGKHIDHCHRTGIVRGTLCGNCNRMLGGARDSSEILRQAIEYLSLSRCRVKHG